MTPRALMIRLLATAVLAAAAVGTALAQVSPPAVPASPKRVQIGGASVGQFGYFTAVGWANALAKAPGYRASAVATSGFAENAQLIAQKQLDFGWVAGRTFDDARAGGTSIIKASEVDNFRALFTLPSGANHVIVLQSSPVRSLSDLTGKRITGFVRGSGGWDYVVDVLGAVNIAKTGYRMEPLGPAEAMQALKQGTADVVWATGNAPAPAVVELGATTPFRLIPIPANVLAKLAAGMPSWQVATIPKGVYSNAEGNADVETIQQTQVGATQQTMDDETAYAMTWAVMEHLDVFGAVHPGAKLLTLRNSLNGMSVPLHRGALRYYRAKGIRVPDALIPPEAK